ncbi:MAG: cytochrome C oxidase subunit IV family protein [Terracidiphilus sp.]
MSEQEKHDEHELHIVSPRIYVAVGVALLILTGSTVAASYIEMGVFNAIVALGIAVIKAMLVVLFFMHVKYSPKLTKLTAMAGIFMFLVLVGMTLADYMTRAWGRW